MTSPARIAAAASLTAAFAVTALAASACFDPPEPACGLACGPGERCPDGYRCAPDGWCKRADVDDDFDCGAALLDAAEPDAGASDEPDASSDAAPRRDAEANARRAPAAGSAHVDAPARREVTDDAPRDDARARKAAADGAATRHI